MNSKLWQGRPRPCGKAEAALLHPIANGRIRQLSPLSQAPTLATLGTCNTGAPMRKLPFTAMA